MCFYFFQSYILSSQNQQSRIVEKMALSNKNRKSENGSKYAILYVKRIKIILRELGKMPSKNNMEEFN